MNTCFVFLRRVSAKRFRGTVLLVLLLLAWIVALPADAQELRTWTSKTGKFQKQATLIETKSDRVMLRLGDGKTIEVPIASLSIEDQNYIESLDNSNLDPIVDLRGAKLGAELANRIAEFHTGSEESGEVLRVIYFHGSDSKPQPDYEQRLDRVMSDIQDFYAEEMKKNGFRSASQLPLETEDGKLVIHVVVGKNPTNFYSARSESAYAIRSECKLALRGRVDFDSDYALMICGLVKKNGQNYVFNSPNYGLPFDHTRGCSFVPDCDKFDPNAINDTKSKINYSKEGKSFVETLAKYNSKRLGAAAHELGHALNLPHNGQTDSELSRKGTALMGYGNRTYRKQLWDKKNKGTFMTLAMSASLAAHPLFTGSDKDRWTVANCKFESLDYAINGRKFEIKGVVKSEPPPLAVIAFVDPAGGTANRDYDATTWVGGVGRGGSFHVTVEKHLPGPHELRLTVLMANGATARPVAGQYVANKKGEPDLKRLASMQLVAPIEKLLAAGQHEQAATEALKQLEQLNDTEAPETLIAQLQHIVALTKPGEVKSLSSISGDSVFLSEVEWQSAKVGFGQPARDRFFVNPKKAAKHQAGVLLQVGGKFHEKGLYAHANSSFVFNLDGKWSEFESIVGLQPGARGRVKFSVKGDGRSLYSSDELAGSEIETVKLKIKGIKKLELIANSTNKAIGGSWTIWASPKLSR